MTAVLIDYFQRKPRQIGEIRATAIRPLYGLFSPASWWAFGVTARRQLASIRMRSVISVLGGRKRICLHSSRTISDCRSRLAGLVGFNTVGPVIGSSSGDRFHLYVVRNDFRNSFAPHFYGRLTTATSGTVIEGKFRMHFFVRIFLSIWFTVVIAIGGRIVIFSIQSLVARRPTEDTYVGLFYPGVLFLCGLLMVYWCKTLGTDDEAQIVTFLQHTLNAQP